MTLSNPVSRRTAIAGFAAATSALALASGAGASQAGSLADHPLVGAWLVVLNLPTAPDKTVVLTSIYTADGFVQHSYPVAEAGQRGVTMKSAAQGVWEAVDDRTGHFTSVQILASADGEFAGTLTLDGHPQVSEDGATFEDVNPDDHATIRNAANDVVADIPGSSPRPVRGYRITPGNVSFPASEEATPVASGDLNLPHPTA